MKRGLAYPPVDPWGSFGFSDRPGWEYGAGQHGPDREREGLPLPLGVIRF